MVVAPCLNELLNIQQEIEKLNQTKPTLFQKFINVIQLTRQLQYGYQFMGALLMDEDPSNFYPVSQDDYVLSVYEHEIEKLKTDSRFQELKQLLTKYRELSYVNISKLALGTNPKLLVGPTLIR